MSGTQVNTGGGSGHEASVDEQMALKQQMTQRHHSAKLVSNAAHITMNINSHASISHHANN